MKSKKTNKKQEIKNNEEPAVKINTKKQLILKGVTLLIPILFFVLLEAGLRVAGYGVNTDLFIDMSGDYKNYRQCNRYVALRYFDYKVAVPSPSTDLFLKNKTQSTYRIFVLGGSSAAGYPYGENVMFSRILNGWLSDTFPGKNIEVVNTAMPAVNSFTMLDFVDEILENQPDLVLIYSGHNEYYGALGVGSSVSLGHSPTLVYLMLKLQKFKTVRLLKDMISAVNSMFAEESPANNATLMERMVEEQTIPYNSDLYNQGIEQFKNNLGEIVRRIRAENVNVLVSELVSNIKDQKPFISVRGQYDADIKYKEAEEQFNDGAFDSARKLFYSAKDFDALRFRAPEAFNKIIHQLSEEYDFPVVKLEKYFEAESPHELIGNSLILEHLHPNETGYALMAKAFYRTMKTEKYISDNWPEIPISTDKKNLAVTALDSAYAALRIHILKGGWPFKPRSLPNTAFNDFVAKNKVDSIAVRVWDDPNYTLERGHVELAGHYTNHSQINLAVHEYKALTRLTPYNESPYQRAAELLINHQQYKDAVIYLKGLLKIKDSYYANKWLGQILLQYGETGQAINYLDKAFNKNSNDQQLLYNYGGALFVNKNYSKSLQVLNKLENINPDFPGLKTLKTHVESLLNN